MCCCPVSRCSATGRRGGTRAPCRRGWPRARPQGLSVGGEQTRRTPRPTGGKTGRPLSQSQLDVRRRNSGGKGAGSGQGVRGGGSGEGVRGGGGTGSGVLGAGSEFGSWGAGELGSGTASRLRLCTRCPPGWAPGRRPTWPPGPAPQRPGRARGRRPAAPGRTRRGRGGFSRPFGGSTRPPQLEPARAGSGWNSGSGGGGSRGGRRRVGAPRVAPVVVALLRGRLRPAAATTSRARMTPPHPPGPGRAGAPRAPASGCSPSRRRTGVHPDSLAGRRQIFFVRHRYCPMG